MNVGKILLRTARRHPNVIAIQDEETGSSISFKQLLDVIYAIGRHLLDGLAQGDRVAVLGGSTLTYLCAEYGAMSGGLVRVPLDPDLTDEELGSQLRAAGARALIYSDAFESRVRALADDDLRLIPFGDLLQSCTDDVIEKEAFPFDVPPDAVASYNYSGGTSGRPKAVIHTHGSLSAVVQNIVAVRGMGCGDVMLNVRPLWPIAAIVVLAHLAAGGSVVLARSRFSPIGFLESLKRYEAACSSLVPTHLSRIVREVRDTPDLPKLRLLDIGAASTPPDVLTAAARLFPGKLSAIYGMTEAPWSCYRSAADLKQAQAAGRDLTGFVGYPTFGTDLRIVSETGSPCRIDQPGEIQLCGPHVMSGYLDPALTQHAFVDGWLRTGDLGALSADGALYVRGRLKELIRTGGKSVQPQEVEDALARHPQVREVAVFGLPDSEWGEIVTAAVVTEEGQNVTPEALIAFAKASVASHKCPKAVYFLPALPRSHYGKVLKNKIIASLRSHTCAGEAAPGVH